MRYSVAEIQKDLQEKTNFMINQADHYKTLDLDQLNARIEEKKWSILECFEHINLYGDFYLPEISRCIAYSKHSPSDIFKSGWFGNYSAKNMLPKDDGKIPMKMNTFKEMNPIHSKLNISVLDKFIEDQERFLHLLKEAEKTNWTKTKTKLTIKGLKFRLGDTLRFYAFHNYRHVIQAQNTGIGLGL